MNSVNPKIIEIADRVITIHIRDAAVAAQVGREIKLDGFRASWVACLPSKESDGDESSLVNALEYRIEGKDDIHSLKVASICEVTWG
jgi:hypothetical protein